MRSHYLTKYFPKFIQKHRIPKKQFHEFRYSCASLQLEIRTSQAYSRMDFTIEHQHNRKYLTPISTTDLKLALHKRWKKEFFSKAR